MDTTFLREVWKTACKNQKEACAREAGTIDEVDRLDIRMYNTDTPDFTLPYQDKAEQVIGFIERHELDALQRMTKPLTKEDASWLLSRFPQHVIEDVLMSMENFSRLNSKYKSAKLTANSWCKRRMNDMQGNNGNNQSRAQYA